MSSEKHSVLRHFHAVRLSFNSLLQNDFLITPLGIHKVWFSPSYNRTLLEFWLMKSTEPWVANASSFLALANPEWYWLLLKSDWPFVCLPKNIFHKSESFHPLIWDKVVQLVNIRPALSEHSKSTVCKIGCDVFFLSSVTRAVSNGYDKFIRQTLKFTSVGAEDTGCKKHHTNTSVEKHCSTGS